MKLGTTTLVLGVALAVVAGLFSSTIFGLVGTKTDAQTSASTSALFNGHVTTIVSDAAGNVKEYRQSDNLIVNQGENCVIKMLFGESGGSSVGDGDNTCVGAITDGFRWIAIGNGTGVAGNLNFTLGNEYVANMGRVEGTVDLANSTAATGISQAIATIEATFTNNDNDGETVEESGLFNGTLSATDGLFARQQFDTITLNNGDSLTVRWTVNIGGTGTIDQSGP
jgi:hypothetical protein